MTETAHTSVTISRQIGSGGSYIGYLVARELGFTYIDREILRRAAEHLGTEPGLLEHYEERSSSFIENILTRFTFGVSEMAYVPPLQQPVYDRDLFAIESRIMHDIADRYNSVIVGRGGFFALKDRSDVVRVFIHAPEEFRVRRVMQVQNIADAQEAARKVRESDQRRARFVKNVLGVSFTDAKNYHLCIDASQAGFSESVAMIIRLVDKKKENRPR
jgi:cytidylate kinase